MVDTVIEQLIQLAPQYKWSYIPIALLAASIGMWQKSPVFVLGMLGILGFLTQPHMIEMLDETSRWALSFINVATIVSFISYVVGYALAYVFR